jgi:putative membrane protein
MHILDIKYITALHIIFIVTWFAGLFYIVRLFIYHTEANDFEEPKKSILQSQYKIMESRLWYGITWPSMILTLASGGYLIYEMPLYLLHNYFLVKLCFVFGLVCYHIACHSIFKQLQNDIIKYSSFKLRIWNEVATLFLVSIVFLIVVRSDKSLKNGILGLILFSAILMIAIRLYKKKREKMTE